MGRRAKPRWDAANHTLWWRGSVVKHFRADAPEQEALLAAFQKAGWPPCLEVVVFRGSKLAGKGCLRATICNLNQSVKPHLHFGLEGSGRRVCWAEGQGR